MSNVAVARAVRWVRSQVRGVPAHIIIWTILACSATICLLQTFRKAKTNTHEAASTQAKTAFEIASASGGLNKRMEEEPTVEEEEENEIGSGGSDDDTEAFGHDEDEE